jgi:hypothetical protein
MTARTRPRIPLSAEERRALLCLSFLVRRGVAFIPRNPVLSARLDALLTEAGAYR